MYAILKSIGLSTGPTSSIPASQHKPGTISGLCSNPLLYLDLSFLICKPIELCLAVFST